MNGSINRFNSKANRGSDFGQIHNRNYNQLFWYILKVKKLIENIIVLIKSTMQIITYISVLHVSRIKVQAKEK